MVHIELTITRRHLTILIGILLAGLMLIPGVAGASHTFEDVDDDNVFHADIDWLAAAGVTKGCNPPDNTMFCPGSPVTREQMAAFMHRLSGDDDTTLDSRLDALEALLAGVSRNGDILLFDGMNLQVVNGTGSTFSTNGLGNLVIGYNEDDGDIRTGSHMLVVGVYHTYTGSGGIVAGEDNETSADYSSVLGGSGNIARGHASSVTGGNSSLASGSFSSVSGGSENVASAQASSVSGGFVNIASGMNSAIAGGGFNETSGNTGAVLGGSGNVVSADFATVLGGRGNVSATDYASMGGGDYRGCGSTGPIFCAEGVIWAED